MICFPLDNTPYNADALGAYMASRTRGVLAAEGHYRVEAAGGMTLQVRGGVAWLKMEENWGVTAYEKSTTELEVEVSHAVLSRIDAVCLRLDKNENKAELLVKKGVASLTPALAPPVRDMYYDELYLATVQVPAGLAAIGQAQISDTRLDEALCGLMRDGVTGLPAAGINAQAQALLDAIRDQLEATATSDAVMLKTEYAPDATAVISGGRLVVTSRYPRAGTLYDVRFTAPAAQGTTPVTIDGANVTVMDSKFETVTNAWENGAPVTLTRKGTQAFFKTGGGALDIKLLGGTTRPQNPAEGTIWAYTTQAVGKVFCGPDTPAAANNDVWIVTGQSSVHFYAGSVDIAPVALMQYQNGGFVARPFRVWTGGRWRLAYPTDGLLFYCPMDGNLTNLADGMVGTKGNSASFAADATAGTVFAGTATSTSYCYWDNPASQQNKAGSVVAAYKVAAGTVGNKPMVTIGANTGSAGMHLGWNEGYIGGNAGGTTWTMSDTAASNDGLWHSACLTIDGASRAAALYRDGELRLNGTLSILTGGSDRICVGCRSVQPSAGVAFVGNLAHAFIYTRTLRDVEAKALGVTLWHMVRGLI